MYNLVLYLTMMTVFISYLLFIYFRYGLLHSISTSYYQLPEKWNWLFLAFTWGYGIPALMLATTGLMFFSGGIILFVGIASAFRNNDFTMMVHSRSAFVAITLSQLSIIFDYKMWYISAFFVVAVGVLWYFRKSFPTWMFWLEVLAFLCISFVLGISIL